MIRLPTSSFDEKDPDTWSVTDFHRVITNHYLASMEDAEALKQTSLKDYAPIIIKGNSQKLRPTLYDLLAHQALQYFENDERDISSPINAFHIDDPIAFSTSATFSKANIKTTDTASLYYRALQIYQDLLAFHLTDKDPSALLDADLARLAFVNRVSVIPEKKRSVYTCA
jgi:hypothetical protein